MTGDLEKIVTAHLSTELSERVAGETPHDTTQKWVKVTLLDVETVGNRDADFFHAYHLQFDCYAGRDGREGQGEANELCRNTRAALKALDGQTKDTAIISAVRFGTMMRLPDTAFEPARQRYMLEATVYARFHS